MKDFYKSKEFWIVFVFVLIFLYLFSRYGFFKFLGIKGADCNNPKSTLGGTYEYGSCNVR